MGQSTGGADPYGASFANNGGMPLGNTGGGGAASAAGGGAGAGSMIPWVAIAKAAVKTVTGVAGAINQGQYQARMNRFNTAQAEIDGKFAYNEAKAKSIAIIQESNNVNANAVVAKNTKGTMNVKGDSGSVALDKVNSTTDFNIRYANLSANIVRGSHRLRVANLKHQRKVIKHNTKLKIANSLLGQGQ